LDEAATHAASTDIVKIRGDRGPYRGLAHIVTVADEVHGVFGRPRLLFSDSASQGLGAFTPSVTVDHLYIQAPADALALNGGDARDIVAVTTADSVTTCFVRNPGLTNVVCWAKGNGSVALQDMADAYDTVTVAQNVTAIASGFNGIAIREQASNGNRGKFILHEVIARGGAAPNGLDLLTITDGSASTVAEFDSEHSNFATHAGAGPGAQDPAPSATDQSAAPVFVDAAHGDFHEACGSPTIDRGDTAFMATDFDGDPRLVGSAVDIGADEFVPGPAAVTTSATGVKPTSATLTGAINPRGCAVTYHFEYGLTTAYGHRTPDQTLARGSSPRPVSAVAGHLAGATQYHFRLVATSASGTGRGADRTFTTGHTFAGVKLVSKTAAVRHGRARIRVRCPAGAARTCAGTLRLKTARKVRLRRGARRRFVALGRKHFSIPAGRTARVSVKLSHAGRALLKREGTLEARARAVATDSSGKRGTTNRRITLKRPRP
jgi:hypothetical protein